MTLPDLPHDHIRLKSTLEHLQLENKLVTHFILQAFRSTHLFPEEDSLVSEETLHTCAEIERLILEKTSQFDQILSECHDLATHFDLYQSCLSLYRNILILRSTLVRNLSWASTAYNQSLEPYYFWKDTTGYKTNRFNYDRAGGYRQEQLGPIFQKALGINSPVHSLLTNSCMSALNLLEHLLLEEADALPVKILLPRKIYFETQFAFFKNSQLFQVETFDYHTPDKIIEVIQSNEPQVLILETLQNLHGLQRLDVMSLLEQVTNTNCPSVRSVIIDDSALPGTYDPFELYERSRRPTFETYYVASCSKYLQLGFDLIPLGILITHKERTKKLTAIGAARGCLAAETSLWAVPEITPEMFQNRITQMSSNALSFAEALTQRTVNSDFEVSYPFPDMQKSNACPYGGGLITCVSHTHNDESDDLIAHRYHKAISNIIKKSADNGITIADSEGFGFHNPRIHLCKWPEERPFLRFAFGDIPNKHIPLLADICHESFLSQGLL